MKFTSLTSAAGRVLSTIWYTILTKGPLGTGSASGEAAVGGASGISWSAIGDDGERGNVGVSYN